MIIDSTKAIADVRVSLTALQLAQERLVAAQTSDDPRGDVTAALGLVTAVIEATERGLAALRVGGIEGPKTRMEIN
jgi:hypothetical protein